MQKSRLCRTGAVSRAGAGVWGGGSLDAQGVAGDFGCEPHDGLEVEFLEEGKVEFGRLPAADEAVADESELHRRDVVALRGPDPAQGDAAAVRQGGRVSAGDGFDGLACRRRRSLLLLLGLLGLLRLRLLVHRVAGCCG